MDIYFSDESNPEVAALLRDGHRVLVDAEIVVDDPGSNDPEFSLIVHSFSTDQATHKLVGQGPLTNFDNLSEVEEIVLMDRLHFRWHYEVYSAVVEAFFGDEILAPDMDLKTLTPDAIYYTTFFPKWGPRMQAFRTGLEKLVDNTLLLSETRAERRPGKRRHYQPNRASLPFWVKLIEKYGQE